MPIKRRQKAKGLVQKVFTVRMGIFTPPVQTRHGKSLHYIDGRYDVDREEIFIIAGEQETIEITIIPNRENR